MRAGVRIVLLLPLLLLSACAGDGGALPEKQPQLRLRPASFQALPGWEEDRHDQALPALRRSCGRLTRLSDDKFSSLPSWAGSASDWRNACAALPPETASPEEARGYFETWFSPVAAWADDRPEGLFTGYFEASLRGSLVRQGAYQIPLRLRPADLVMVNLGEFREELKGQRIAGRVVDGNLKPYEDRAAIEDGKLPAGQDKPLVWVDSAVDAFFLQVQGSGVVTLPDGKIMRVGFDAQNGHPYSAIGKELVKRGHLEAGKVSMQAIRRWLAENPVEGREVMRTNKSYIFFREPDQNGPVGGEGVVLTPERSLAVDRSLIPYGLPVYIDAQGLAETDPRLRRLLIAQDTGGAIRGPVRGDMFWGFGEKAEAAAGIMQSRGRWWFLLPKAAGLPDKS